MLKEQKGITLIALVITIIVLLILAGVTIAMLSGNDSAPKKAQQAAQETKVAEAKEQLAMDVVDKYTTYMAGKYQTNTISDASFTAYLASNAGKLSSKANTYAVSGVSVTLAVPDNDGNYATGTITDGGSINWSGSTNTAPTID